MIRSSILTAPACVTFLETQKLLKSICFDVGLGREGDFNQSKPSMLRLRGCYYLA